MIRKETLIKRIINSLSILRVSISSYGKNDFADLPKSCEDFFLELLNMIYGLKLVNLNDEKMNFPGLDLGDDLKKFGYQIGASITSKKVNESLDKILSNKLYNRFNDIKYLCLTKKQNSYSITTVTAPHFEFDSKSQIVDIDDILKDIKSLKTEQITEIDKFILSELELANNSLLHEEGSSNNTDLLNHNTLLNEVKYNSFIKWKIKVKIKGLKNMTSAQTADLIYKNIITRYGNPEPIILSTYFRIQNHPVIIHKSNLTRKSATNNLDAQALSINRNEIQFEYFETYSDDLFLIDTRTPISTLIYLLLIIKKIHSSINNSKPIIISVETISNGNIQLLHHPNHIEFSFDTRLAKYSFTSNSNSYLTKLKSIERSSILSLINGILRFFVNENKISLYINPTISEENFDFVINNIEKELNLNIN